MKRKALAVIVTILCLLAFVGGFALAVGLPSISNNSPLICYTYNNSGKIYAYTDSSLKTKTGGYISCSTDECKIIEIKENAVKVKYPVSGGTKTAWFSREAFTYRNLKNEGAKSSFKAKNTVDVYRWKGKTTKLGSISKNDICYLLRGDEKSDWLQLIYPVSGGYKMGWIKNADYIKILPVAESVKLDKSTIAFNTAGSTATLKATVNPSDATNKTITWSTSNSNVATVSSSGVVTAKANGTATITAATSNGKKATATVTVKINVPVSSVTLDKSAISLYSQGATAKLIATVNPSNATNKTITWSSSNTNVATVSSSGVVTAKANGTATITAAASNGKKATVSITVIISGKITPVTSINFDKTAITLYGVGSEAIVTMTIVPSNATDKKVTWKATNSSVSKIQVSGNKYKITALKLGTNKYTATSSNGKTATITVNVVAQNATAVKLNKSSATLKGKNASTTLTATVTPSNTTNKTITWSTSDKNIAKVSSAGKVTAVNNGTATITAKTANGKTATCKITVSSVKATSIKLNKSSITLNIGESNTVKATISPSNSTDEVAWTSSNKNIATVSSSGKISAKKAGSCTITAKSTSGKTAKVKVTVKSENIYTDTSALDSAAKKYNIKADSKAYYALLSIKSKYASQLSSSNKKGVVVFVFEGVGNNSNANKRMNAMCVVVKNGKIEYINKNSSTIPDYPFKPSTNEGDPVPTIKNGIYGFTTVNHKGNYAALNISKAQVVRFKTKSSFYDSSSKAINVHRRYSDNIPLLNKGWVNSSGCLNIGNTGTSGSSEYAKFAKAVGIISSGGNGQSKYTNYITGKIVIDRDYAYDYMSKIGYSSAALKKLGVTNSTEKLLFPLKGSITRSSTRKTNGFYCDYITGVSVPVYAPADGTVVFKQAYRNTKDGKKLSSYGNFVEFTSSDKVYKVKCCHLTSFNNVETIIKTSLPPKCSGSDDTLTLKTKKVVQGELLGYSGKTGNASGHHLHLEVYKNGKAVNPVKVFSAW